jgi:hypothetical protein
VLKLPATLIFTAAPRWASAAAPDLTIDDPTLRDAPRDDERVRSLGISAALGAAFAAGSAFRFP